MFASSFRQTARSAVRGYSTATPVGKSQSNLAPVFLGAGIVGAGLFYYSTLGQKDVAAGESKDALKKGDTQGTIKTPGPAALSGDEFRNFKLSKIEKINHNTSSFTFDLPEGTSSGLTVASALVTKAVEEGKAVGKNGKPVVRPYTPVTAPNVEGKLELMVKHYPGGIMTEHIFSLKEGDQLSIKGPIPKFEYKKNEFKDIALIAGGSGITPMWQIMQHIAANKDDKTNVHLVFGNVTEEDILLRKEFDSLAKSDSRFKVHYVLDKPPKNWSGLSGYINADALKKAIPGPDSGEQLKIFVCGPPGQVKAISGPKASFKDQGELDGALKELGYKKEQVFKF